MSFIIKLWLNLNGWAATLSNYFCRMVGLLNICWQKVRKKEEPLPWPSNKTTTALYLEHREPLQSPSSFSFRKTKKESPQLYQSISTLLYSITHSSWVGLTFAKKVTYRTYPFKSSFSYFLRAQFSLSPSICSTVQVKICSFHATQL